MDMAAARTSVEPVYTGGCEESVPSAEHIEPLIGNYFVAAYPPFSSWMPAATRNVEAVSLQPAPTAEPIGIYVHVPFCQKKCDYCYYLSYIGQQPATISRYIDCVVRELQLYAARPAVSGRPLAFVYFGGGTPSMLTKEQVRSLGSGLLLASDHTV